MRPSEIRELNTTEVHAKLDGARQELFNLRFQRAAGQLKDHSRLKIVRRDIARYLTVLNERQILEEWEAMLAEEKSEGTAVEGAEGTPSSSSGDSAADNEEVA